MRTLGKNKVLIEDFIIALRREGVAKATITVHISYITRMAQQLQEIGFTETLDKLAPNTFDRLLIFLEDERKLSPGTIRGSVAKNICQGYTKIKMKSKIVICYLIPSNGSTLSVKLSY